jgi:hypothetical protein
VGTTYGVREGEAVDIYANSYVPVKALGRMEIDRHVAPRISFLKFGSYPKFKVPDPFFVSVAGPSARLICFCTDDKLKSALEDAIAFRCPGVKIVNKAEEDCDVTIAKELKKVVISRTEVNRCHVTPLLTFKDHFRHDVLVDRKLSSLNLEVLCYILSSAARFYHHLTRSAPDDSSKVKVDLIQLERDPDNLQHHVPLPGGDVVVEERRASITLKTSSLHGDYKRLSSPIGMRLHNNNDFGLQPYVFYFDPTRLEIGNFHFIFLVANY